MNTSFYSVSHNSFDTRGFPWIMSIISGRDRLTDCPECGIDLWHMEGDLRVKLERNKARRWPDVLGCGEVPGLFIVTSRVVDDWKRDQVAKPVLGGRVIPIPPYPDPLRDSDAPEYVWIDGARMMGARLDFDATGYVGVRICSRCGRVAFDIEGTYERHNQVGWPFVFLGSSWSGSTLFTTDLTPYKFFCTVDLMACARKYRHSNFRFVPIEAGIASWSKGLDYLGKKWPPSLPPPPPE